MASTCVNIPITPPHPNTSFLNIPWLSLSNDHPTPPDFEFHLLDHPTSTVLSADQLFSNGKLITTTTATTTVTTTVDNTHHKTTDFSPKAPRCSSRWREILGLKNKSPKTTSFNTESKTASFSSGKLLKFSTEEITKTASFSSGKSIKRLLQKNTKTPTTTTTTDTSPLLDSLTESSLSISTSRLSLSSLSSSTSSSDETLHRYSLDETRPRITLLKPKQNPVPTRPVRRTPKPIQQTGVSADSPRMNSAGKVVFQSLNRSSSSPGSFNGGPRYKHRGMERSYSANVRVTPVLNVPVCSSLRGSSKSVGFGFGQLFTSSSSSVTQRKDKGSFNGEKKRSSILVA